jgi:hypothetical protein
MLKQNLIYDYSCGIDCRWQIFLHFLDEVRTDPEPIVRNTSYQNSLSDLSTKVLQMVFLHPWHLQHFCPDAGLGLD